MNMSGIMNRKRMRNVDIEESYALLMELACSEPVLQYCFSVIDAVCLCEPIRGEGVSTDFSKFLNRFWQPFLHDALRAMHIYGFVPYYLRRLKSGDKVPEVLPPGTFRWTVVIDKESDAFIEYKISLVPGMKDIGKIYVENWKPINYNVTENSLLYATVSSPIAYVIESYRNLQEALKRQAHADAWNCTARITIEHDPKEYNHDTHRKELFHTFGFVDPAVPSNDTGYVADMYADRSRNHYPAVYELPKHHHVQDTRALAPCSNIDFLYNKYKSDVCFVTGVPLELLGVVTSASKQQTRSSSLSRFFQARCLTICRFLERLASHIYGQVYQSKSIAFALTPMPRLEISELTDLVPLFETGIMQPQHQKPMSTMLFNAL